MSKSLCPACAAGKPKRTYTRISLPGFERQTTAQRASTAIQAGPLQQSGVGSRQNPYSTIRPQDLSKVTVCKTCGKLASIESVCFSLTTGTAVQFVRCRACKSVENRLQ